MVGWIKVGKRFRKVNEIILSKENRMSNIRNEIFTRFHSIDYKNLYFFKSVKGNLFGSFR